MKISPSATPLLLLAGIALIWGSQFLFNQVVIQDLPPLTLSAGRATIGALTLAVIGWLRPSEKKAQAAPGMWKTYCLLAFFEGLLPLFLLSWGQTRVDSSIAAILMGTIPIFTILLAPAFVPGNHWNAPAILSVICGFAGIVILVGPNLHAESSGLLGELAVLGAAASVSVSLLLFNRLGDVSPVTAVRHILTLAAIPLVLLALIHDQPWTLHITPPSIVALLILGIFCAGIVYLMFAQLIKLSGSVYTSLVNYLTPVVGVLMGGAIIGESVGLNAWLALAFIVSALLINQPELLQRLWTRSAA